MIKTFNINLAGQAFTINEDAYEMLTQYFNSIRHYYKNEDGKDEIIQDIEARFAEIFYKNGKDKIIDLQDANQVIQMMGKPEDFDTENQENPNASNFEKDTNTNQNPTEKRLYRDVDDYVIAGVCSGLSKYLGIKDPIWMRILFVISPFLTLGTALIIYVILWIIMPEAKTASQKLAMKGQPINLSNLEKKNNDIIGNNSDNPLNTIISVIGDIANACIKFFILLFKFIVFLIFFSIIIALLVAFISFIVAIFAGVPIANKFFFDANIYSTYLVLGGLLIGIATLIGFVLVTIHLLSKQNKPLSKKTVLPLLGLLLIGFVFIGISTKEASKYFKENRKLSQTLPLEYSNIGDTLKLEISNMEKEDFNIEINSFKDFMDFVGKDYSITPDVEIRILPSNSDSFYVLKEYAAYGKTEQEALKNATSIEHQVMQINNKLIIDPYFKFNTKKYKIRNQKLIFKVFVPDGKIIAWNEKTEEFINENLLPINWNEEEIKKFNLNVNQNKNVVINVNGKSINIDANQDSININGNIISVDDEEEIEEAIDDLWKREHYVFIMKNAELIPID
jgi:phage shock protein PspC (stress-responsive transcriptional regulator)